jgi:FtsP/CotA-like multicopper oxidase with cupredoxin domain
MFPTKFKWMRLAIVLVMSLLVFGPLAHVQSAQAQAPGPATGIVCTTGPTFNLTAQEGYIVMPDMNSMYMWSFSPSVGNFQHPGPVLCVDQGATVTINLTNSLPYGLTTSMAFPGQENVEFSTDNITYQPVQPDLANNSLTTTVAAGANIYYRFNATHPGTFIYESGTDPKTQVTMGLFGALIVRPTQGADFIYNRTDSQFIPTEEFMALLSEVDPYQHDAWGTSASAGESFDMSTYRARYWLINGRGFPDSIADNFATWLPAQPYGALARIYPKDTNEFLDPPTNSQPNPAYHPYPAVERFINVGTEEYPFHPHGQNGLLIGRDGTPLEGPSGEELSYDNFLVNIGPGQTWDVIFEWYDAEQYNGDQFLSDGITSNPAYHPVPVTIPDLVNMTIGLFYSGSPYLGVQETMPPGVSTLNQCGEYFIISHNHALFQLDAFGQTASGPITYLRIDPPQPNGCP